MNITRSSPIDPNDINFTIGVGSIVHVNILDGDAIVVAINDVAVGLVIKRRGYGYNWLWLKKDHLTDIRIGTPKCSKESFDMEEVWHVIQKLHNSVHTWMSPKYPDANQPKSASDGMDILEVAYNTPLISKEEKLLFALTRLK